MTSEEIRSAPSELLRRRVATLNKLKAARVATWDDELEIQIIRRELRLDGESS